MAASGDDESGDRPKFSPYFGHSSARDYETANGFTGIFVPYKLPDSFGVPPSASLERWLDERLPAIESPTDSPERRKIRRELNDFNDRVVALNHPALDTIDRVPSDIGREHDILRGVAYGFNPADISFF